MDQAVPDGLSGASQEPIIALMKSIDRREAHGEAQYAILEAALYLLSVDGSPQVEADLADRLYAALGAARAAVVAINYALVGAGRNRTVEHRLGGSESAG